MRETAAAALLLIGAAFTLVAAFGLVRVRDSFSRLQVATKSATLGTTGALLGSLLFHGWGWEELLVIGFLFLTAPVGAHMLAKAMHEREEERPPAR